MITNKFINRLSEVTPFLVSALLFVTGFLAVFAPLPLLIYSFRRSYFILFLAVLSNALGVYYLAGPTLFQFYLLGVGILVMTFPLMIRLMKGGIAKTVSSLWIFQTLVVLVFVAVYAIKNGHNLGEEIKLQLNSFVDTIVASIHPDSQKQILGMITLDEWKRQLFVELPSSLAILSLVTLVINLGVLIRLNPNHWVEKRAWTSNEFQSWTNSSFLLWLTLALWAVVLFTKSPSSDWMMGFLKICVSFYVIQGLAVTTKALDVWKVFGFFRMIIISVLLMMLMPLLVGLGFFDQWFDYRSKLTRSK